MYFMNSWILNEAVSGYDAASGNEDIIEKLGEISVYDYKTKDFTKVKSSSIIKVVNDGVYKMQRDYPYLYQFMAKCKIMYIPTYPSEICDTMCVDNYNNLWISCSYVYNECLMDSNRVFGVLFHEMFHVFFDHLMRFNEMYPADMFTGGLEGARKKANMKANICMDYEVNASMAEDGIVDDGFFKRMNMLYKKEYTGLTWEEIMNKAGDFEYKDWLSRNGFNLDDIELKLLDAIEKASKVLMDPAAEDEEKRAARRELQKTIDDLLGKESSGEKGIQEMMEDLAKSKLGDIGDLSMDMDELVDDLYKNPASMSDEELDETLKHIDKFMDDLTENSSEVGEQFGKSSEEVSNDAAKARESFKEAMKKMKEGGLSKEEKQDLIDKAKDDLEDIISDDVEKEKLKKKREERDAKKKEERKEKFKKTHPIRSLIIIMKNFAGLKQFGVVSEKTVKTAEKCMEVLEPLTELKFSEMKKSDFDDPITYFTKLKDCFLPDLVALIDNETILNKTEDDMKRLLDGVFDFVFKAFDTALNNDLDEDARGSLMKTAAQKMRIIGKVLKTQKVWRTSEEFKEAYIEEMKRMMEMYKNGEVEELMKELIDKGVINPMFLDEKSRDIYHKVMSGGRKTEVEDKEALKYTEVMDGVEPYEGKVYYNLYSGDDSETILELSSKSDGILDHDYEPLGVRFEKDYPEYRVEESSESVFEVCFDGTTDSVDIDDLREKLESNPDYEIGEW